MNVGLDLHPARRGRADVVAPGRSIGAPGSRSRPGPRVSPWRVLDVGGRFDPRAAR
ncbi:MAG: hypothetical protein BWY94_01894 [Actinobacteria bacterium ADurb.BinA094]|nr:MAG: hypothetical protein BWY94_01894 [Actinobacteria bacterium ADurb.BinA094]